MAVKVSNVVDPTLLFEFTCTEWALMSDATKADWTVTENSCGVFSGFGSPYAAGELAPTLSGAIGADTPITLTLIDGVYTVGITAGTQGQLMRYNDATAAWAAYSGATDGHVLTWDTTNGWQAEKVDAIAVTADTTTNAWFYPTFTDAAGDDKSLIISGSGKLRYNPLQGALAAFNFEGDLTGNVFGDVSGNVSGTASNVTGIVAIVNGDTGQTTAANAINALVPSQAGNAGKALTTNGTVVSWATITAALADGDYGDITVSGSGATLTIDSDAVTFAKMQNIATDKLLGRDTAVSGDVEEIGLGASLSFSGTGTIQRAALTGDVTASVNSNTTTIANNAVTDAKFRQGVARSVVGVAGNATANVADIQGTADQVLRVTSAGTGLGFGTVAAGGIASDAITTAKVLDANITLAKIQNITTSRILGRVTAGPGVVEQLTPAEMWTIMNLTGSAGRVAYYSGTNALTNAAEFLWNNTSKILTVTGDITATNRVKASQVVFGTTEPTTGAAGAGMGTGGAITDITGGDNAFTISFSTGTTPTTGGDLFTLTYSTAFPSFAVPVFCQGNEDTANEISKFVFNGMTGGLFALKVRSGQTLTASTNYKLHFNVGGQG